MPLFLLWATSWSLARAGANERRRREAQSAWQRDPAVYTVFKSGVKCKCYSLRVAAISLCSHSFLLTSHFLLPRAKSAAGLLSITLVTVHTIMSQLSLSLRLLFSWLHGCKAHLRSFKCLCIWHSRNMGKETIVYYKTFISNLSE